MNTKSKLEAEVELAVRSQEVLDNILVKDAFVKLRAKYFEIIRKSSHNSNSERESAYQFIVIVDQFEKEFTDTIKNGKKAESKLKQLLNSFKSQF